MYQQTDYEAHQDARIWISRILESKYPFRIRNIFISSIVKLGLPADIIFCTLFVFRHESITNEFFTGYILVMIWINIGPYLIWYYEQKLTENFFNRVTDNAIFDKCTPDLVKKYRGFFSQKYWLITLPWTAACICIYIQYADVFSSLGGIFGIGDVFYWLILAGMVWMGLLTSIGFWGVITTLAVVRNLSCGSISLDPLNGDERGGLNPIGNYIAGTTLLFSSGALFVPIAIMVILGSDVESTYIYLILLAFSIFILLSFFYPTKRIYDCALSAKRIILDRQRQKYFEQLSRLNAEDQNSIRTVVMNLELQRMRDEYSDYVRLPVFPIGSWTWLRVISSVLFPGVIGILELFQWW